MIKPHIVEYLKKKYKKVITVLIMMRRVSMQSKDFMIHMVHGVYPTLSKDVSDAMKEYG